MSEIEELRAEVEWLRQEMRAEEMHADPDVSCPACTHLSVEQQIERADNAEAALVELAPSDEVLVEGSYFQRADLPRILGNYIRAAAQAERETKAEYVRREAAEAEVARLLAECADRESERGDLRDRVQKAEPEVESLRRWKAEATEVILGLQDLGKALGLRLGERITGASATEAAKRLTDRAEAAEGAVARVEDALYDHPHCIGECGCAVNAACAALEGAS